MIKIITDLLNIASFKPFLSAPRQIYKRLCWSISWMVSWSVGQLVGPSISRSVSLCKTFFGLTSYRFALGWILAIHLFLFALLILKRLWLHDVMLCSRGNKSQVLRMKHWIPEENVLLLLSVYWNSWFCIIWQLHCITIEKDHTVALLLLSLCLSLSLSILCPVSQSWSTILNLVLSVVGRGTF